MTDQHDHAVPEPSAAPAADSPTGAGPVSTTEGSSSSPPTPPSGPATTPGHRPTGSISQPTPVYKGEPLDGGRGPGLGCFWFQAILLGIMLVLTPLTVVWAWDSRISATLLIATLVLLLFTGNTVIFLMRLVASDRRGRRRPLNESARRTVGQLEEQAASDASAGTGSDASQGTAPDDGTPPAGPPAD